MLLFFVANNISCFDKGYNRPTILPLVPLCDTFKYMSLTLTFSPFVSSLMPVILCRFKPFYYIFQDVHTKQRNSLGYENGRRIYELVFHIPFDYFCALLVVSLLFHGIVDSVIYGFQNFKKFHYVIYV